MAEDNTGGDDSGESKDEASTKVARANARARKAEERAKAAEQKAIEREEAEARKARDAEIKSAEDAKRALADAEEREKQAMARLKAFEAREAERIDKLMEKLPEADRERVARYRDRLGDDFGAFVQEELDRGGASSSAANEGGDMSDKTNPPPPANPGGVARRNTGSGRTIEPWAQARLDEMGIDSTASKNSLNVERDGSVAKFIYPPEKMKQMLRERAHKPALLSKEEYDKLHR